MVDELYDRHYREGRNELNAFVVRGLGRFGQVVREAFEVLVGIEYSAPWAAKSKRARSN